jgi:hypothetical protein
MGRYVELKKGNYEKIKSELVSRFNIEDIAFLEKVLLAFGEKIDDQYLLLNNEYWEEFNSYYGLSNFIDSYFGIEDSFDVFLEEMTDATANCGVHEVADELGVELPERDEDE